MILLYKFLLSCHLQIDKKINVKEDSRRKTDSNLPSCLVLMRFQQEGMFCSAYHRTLFTQKEAEICR